MMIAISAALRINVVFPGGSAVKNLPASAWNTGDVGSVPGGFSLVGGLQPVGSQRVGQDCGDSIQNEYPAHGELSALAGVICLPA